MARLWLGFGSVHRVALLAYSIGGQVAIGRMPSLYALWQCSSLWAQSFYRIVNRFRPMV